MTMGSRVTTSGQARGGETPEERRGAERRASVRRSSQAVLRHIIDRLPDGIDASARPEQLSVEQIIALSRG